MLYNESDKASDREELRLSDAFEHIGEAKGMLLSGFDEEIYENGLREEGREEAIKDSLNILDLLSSGKSPQEIATELQIEVSLVEKYQEKMMLKV